MSEPIKLEEVLKDIYKDTSDWLKFAEAKNAALLTLNGVLLFGILRISTINNNIILNLQNALYISSSILLVNIIILLISFLPSINESNKKLNNQKVNLSNALFYGEIKNLNHVDFYEKISERYEMEKVNNSFYYDLSLQIVTLSKIATRKYKFFSFCTMVTIVSISLILLKQLFSYI